MSRVFYGHGSQFKNDDARSENDRDEPLFWLLEDDLFNLSVTCDWRFTNRNKAFQNGNQVTDLLREVNYRRTGAGSHYFEPLHIQYIPLRKDLLDIIETQVSDNRGAASIWRGKHDSHPSLQMSMEGGSLTHSNLTHKTGGCFVQELLKTNVKGGLKGLKSGRGVRDHIRNAKEGATRSATQAVKHKAYEVLDRNMKRKFNNIFGD